MAIRLLAFAVMAWLLLPVSPVLSGQDGACRVWREIFAGMPLHRRPFGMEGILVAQ